MTARQAVFTVSRGVPFLPAVADALLSGQLVGPVARDPLALASVSVYLPTRRAARALSAILAARLGDAALLPRTVPLGEADEAELDLAADPLLGAAPARPPIAPLERRLILARLVRAWAQTSTARSCPCRTRCRSSCPPPPPTRWGWRATSKG